MNAKNRKLKFLINQLLKQYDKLHDASAKARTKTNTLIAFKEFDKAVAEARNLQARAVWVLQTANKLFDKLKANILLEETEKVCFT